MYETVKICIEIQFIYICMVSLLTCQYWFRQYELIKQVLRDVNICVIGPLWGESTGHCWIPLERASDVKLWKYLCSQSLNNGISQTVKTTPLYCNCLKTSYLLNGILFIGKTTSLKHCSQVMPYDRIDLGQHWLRHQAITWTSADLQSLTPIPGQFHKNAQDMKKYP